MNIHDDHLIGLLDSIVQVGELVEDLSVDVDFPSSIRFGNAEILVHHLPRERMNKEIHNGGEKTSE